MSALFKLKFSPVAALVCAALSQNAIAEAIVKDGSLKVKTEDNQFQIGGRIMYDFDSFTDVHSYSVSQASATAFDLNAGSDSSDIELRRGRLYVKSDMGDWSAKLQVNIDDSDETANFEDAYLRYEGGKGFKITLGKHKEPFGLEELTSSKYITTIERSMMTNAMSPGRNYGVQVHGHNDSITWGAGIYDNGNNDEEEQVLAFTGRVAFRPIHNDDMLLHIAGAFTSRDNDTQSFRIRERAEVHLAERTVLSNTISANTVNILGAEGAFNYQSFSVQAEYQFADVEATAGEDEEFSGYYAQASVFLTGESRPYKKSSGSFDKVKPKGNMGAWEVVVRYSFLDAEDLDFGSEATNITLGLNYYANKNVRFMLNYIDTEVEYIEPTSTTTIEGDAVALRGQYAF
ncbi:MAG: porin [Pseudomonadota bacterium]